MFWSSLCLRCQRILCIIIFIFSIRGFFLTSHDLKDKVRYTVSLLHVPSTLCRDTDLTLICHSPKSFFCNLPDSGRHMTRPNQVLSMGRRENLGMRLDGNLLWLRLQWHQSCHSNKMTLLPILLAAVFLSTGNCSTKIVLQSWAFFSNSSLDVCEV